MAEVKKSKKVTRIIGRVFTVFISTIVMIFAALYSAMWVFCHGPSTAARDLFVGTVLETGNFLRDGISARMKYLR